MNWPQNLSYCAYSVVQSAREEVKAPAILIIQKTTILLEFFILLRLQKRNDPHTGPPYSLFCLL